MDKLTTVQRGIGDQDAQDDKENLFVHVTMNVTRGRMVVFKGSCGQKLLR